jgi:ribose 5-phosphate isomerase A
VVVDEHTLVPALGPFGTPVEILTFAPAVTMRWITALGAHDVTTRDEPSDNGNVVADAHFGSIDDPDRLAAELDALPGVVEHGLFPASMVDHVLVAGTDGVRELRP